MTNPDDLELEPLPEGEEKPPPLTHTMSVARWVLFGGMCLFALAMVLGYFGVAPWKTGDNGAQQYHCPMHPTYVANQPGDCPICGMSLVPIGDKTAAESADMSHAGDEWMRQTQAGHGQYGCPMDPQVVSDSAGRCPICRMFLVQVDTSKIAGGEHASSESNVPGLAAVTIGPERLQLIGLETGVVERRIVDDPVRMVGYVTPDETRLVDVQVRVSGWVQDLFVDQTGQYVERGQRLLSIYSPELFQAWQEYRNARTIDESADPELIQLRRAIAEAGKNRLRSMGLTDRDIDQMTSDDVSGSVITLRSPSSGHVLAKAVQSGQAIIPAQSLMTIADLSTVWVVADIYERDVARVRVGDAVTVALPDGTAAPLAGTVSFIYPTIGGESRTTRARIEIANPEMRLRPGMYAQVESRMNPRSVLAIPAGAVLDGGETQYAFVVKDGNHFSPRRIEIGSRGDEWMEVLSGLTEGEAVVTSANFLIDSESRLQAAIAGMGQSEPTPAPPAHQH